MIPNIKVTFNLSAKTATVEDLFDYTTIIYQSVYGNITAKLGNTIVHTNTNFDSSADIVIGTNTSFTFDLLTDASGNVIPGSYSFEYNVKVNDETIVSPSQTVTAPGASPFTTIVLNPVDQDIIDTIQDQLDLDGVCTIGFYDNSNVLLGSSTVTTVSGNATINFSSVAIAAFATITQIGITAVTTYTKTFVYAYTTCPAVTPNLCVSSDCYYSQLTAIDSTVYPAYLTSILRELKIQYPRLANGTNVLPTQETNNSSLTIGPNIWTGNYTVSLITVLNWSQTDGLYLTQTISDYVDQPVQCTNGLCDLSTCINSFRSLYMEALATGSRDIQKLALQNQVILLYCNQIRIAIDCKKTSQVTELTTALAAYMNTTNPAIGGCSCGCTDTNQNGYTEPTEIFPLFGPGYTLNLQNITDAGSTTTNAITAQSFNDANGEVKPYTVYSALLTQAGTAAPVATELQDQIGLNASNYSYVTAGNYRITKTGAFPAGKTMVIIGTLESWPQSQIGASIQWAGANIIEIQTSQIGGTGDDDLLNVTPIEIRVYP